jgi:hypothetical protein
LGKWHSDIQQDPVAAGGSEFNARATDLLRSTVNGEDHVPKAASIASIKT